MKNTAFCLEVVGIVTVAIITILQIVSANSVFKRTVTAIIWCSITLAITQLVKASLQYSHVVQTELPELDSSFHHPSESGPHITQTTPSADKLIVENDEKWRAHLEAEQIARIKAEALLQLEAAKTARIEAERVSQVATERDACMNAEKLALETQQRLLEETKRKITPETDPAREPNQAAVDIFPNPRNVIYRGHVGGSSAKFMLRFNINGTVSGTYTYDQDPRVVYQLTGTLNGNGEIRLKELDPSGTQTANLTLFSTGPSEISGTMQNIRPNRYKFLVAMSKI